MRIEDILTANDYEGRGSAQPAVRMESNVYTEGSILHIGEDSVDRDDLTLCPRCRKVRFRYGVVVKDGTRVCSKGCAGAKSAKGGWE